MNLRQSKDELTVKTPADLEGVNLRMPGTDAWQFLGKALGAAPTPMSFSEVYTALSTGGRRWSGQPAANRCGREVLRGHGADRPDVTPR